MHIFHQPKALVHVPAPELIILTVPVSQKHLMMLQPQLGCLHEGSRGISWQYFSLKYLHKITVGTKGERQPGVRKDQKQGPECDYILLSEHLAQGGHVLQALQGAEASEACETHSVLIVFSKSW